MENKVTQRMVIQAFILTGNAFIAELKSECFIQSVKCEVEIINSGFLLKNYMITLQGEQEVVEALVASARKLIQEKASQ